MIRDAGLHLLFFYLCLVINLKSNEKDKNILLVCVFGYAGNRLS